MEVRPEIFQYHDYQIFLRDWLAYRKASQPGFSMRTLAKQSGLASGYLPMVLSGDRPLSGAAMAKLAPFLGLNPSELSFFENLVVLGTSDSHEARVTALERMRRFSKFEKLNPTDSHAFEYLTHWYYVAIREMATIPEFQADAVWIQKQLRFSIPLGEVKAALDFLIQHHYIEIKPDGSVVPPKDFLDCSGGIYRLALAEFHREVFSLASRSIENTPSGDRNIQGNTCSLSPESFDQAKQIMNEALDKIRKLSEGEKRSNSVYHMEIALFPLTKAQEPSREKKTIERKKK
jgi:uncharacterized protein (TIGR02147 family)